MKRFPAQMLEDGWQILHEAGLDEEFGAMDLPEEWIEVRKIQTHHVMLRKGPYLCVKGVYGIGRHEATIDYMEQLEQDVFSPGQGGNFEEYMFDLWKHCQMHQDIDKTIKSMRCLSVK